MKFSLIFFLQKKEQSSILSYIFLQKKEQSYLFFVKKDMTELKITLCS